MKVLDLVLKHKWYDLISNGEKKEEYRSISSYWMRRLCEQYGYGNSHCPHWHNLTKEDTDFLGKSGLHGLNISLGKNVRIKDYTHVRFHRGYTSTTMTFEIDGITIGRGCVDWGAEPNQEYFKIKLGNKL